jgi:hypothetical protein
VGVIAGNSLAEYKPHKASSILSNGANYAKGIEIILYLAEWMIKLHVIAGCLIGAGINGE